MAPSEVKMVAAKDIVADHDVDLSQVLEVAGITDGDGDTLVPEHAVCEALELEPIDRQDDNRAAQPRQFTPGDKHVLADINRRAHQMSFDGSYPLGTTIDTDRRPEKVGKTGRIRYWVNGIESYMENTSFARALEGVEKFSGPKATYDEKLKLANELKDVIARVFPDCALCGQPIDDYGPELAMINQMINGGVLRESGLKPRRGDGQFQLHIRRLDIFCRFWDDVYSDMVIELSMNHDMDADAFLIEKSEYVTAKIQEKRPEVTELEVLTKLQQIRSNLRGLKAQ